MHCPQCGQQPATDRIRYCTHCGFALGEVRDLMNTGSLPDSVGQKDINLGAGLLLVGVVKALLGATIFSYPFSEGSLLLIAAFYGLLQLFFQLSPRQKGLSLGATLMFISSLAAMLASSVTVAGRGAFLIFLFAIPIILFWQKLSAGFLKLFFGKSDAARQGTLNKQQPAEALPPASTSKAVDLDTNRVNQEAVPEPVSVIESTTKTLRESRIS
ncbi:MAG: hypothetical protein AB7P14_17485 [Blastocatellales bacterium]